MGLGRVPVILMLILATLHCLSVSPHGVTNPEVVDDRCGGETGAGVPKGLAKLEAELPQLVGADRLVGTRKERICFGEEELKDRAGCPEPPLER